MNPRLVNNCRVAFSAERRRRAGALDSGAFPWILPAPATQNHAEIPFFVKLRRSSRLRGSSGISLLEIVIYVGLLVLVTVATALFFISILRSFHVVRGEQAAVLNAALALRAAELEIRHADNVYTSTSVFNNDSGQLSLRTPRLAPTDHTFAYVDFYLDNGVLYERRDNGSPAVSLTSGDVNVSVFRIERFTSGTAEGIRLTATASPENISGILAEPRTVHTFVAVRELSP